jgi:hypothetical protein
MPSTSTKGCASAWEVLDDSIGGVCDCKLQLWADISGFTGLNHCSMVEDACDKLGEDVIGDKRNRCSSILRGVCTCC